MESEKPELNAIQLQNAVLCADCEVISDSPHDACRVCGSHSLLSLACILGGTLPTRRAKVIDDDAQQPLFALPPLILMPPPEHTHSRRKRLTRIRAKGRSQG